jgi:hypothetical protein
MTRPSKPADAQEDCPLFAIAPELRNRIYTLVFAVETSEDGSIRLDATTNPPSKALAMSCQRIHNETLAMYRAAYRSFPAHTFTIDMNYRTLPPNISRSLGNDIISRINSIRVTWYVQEFYKNETLRFTTHFDRDARFHAFTVQLKLHDGDGYWRGKRMVGFIIQYYRRHAMESIESFGIACVSRPPADSLGKVLSHAILRIVSAPILKIWIW